MSSNGALEADDLDSIRFVRMQDIQPRNAEDMLNALTDDNSSQMLETCIVEDDGNVQECLVDDNDSNIGSMVSVQSEDVGRIELIIPEVLDPEHEDSEDEHEEVEYLEDIPDSDDMDDLHEEAVEDILDSDDMQDHEETQDSEEIQDQETAQVLEVIQESDTKGSDDSGKAGEPAYGASDLIPKPPVPPNSWPTLEILPGGVINLIADRGGETENKALHNEMMYACAKCSESFRHLFCLVKHVKWHEDEDKRLRLSIAPIERKPEDLKRKTNDINKKLKKQKVKSPTPEASKADKKHGATEKKRNKRVPKKS